MMQQDLNTFLQSVERRAYSMAFMATNNRDEALDIVQESMFKLAEKYANRDAVEWAPLFTRILQSKIRDWYRRNKSRTGLFSWFGLGRYHTDPEFEENQLEQYPDRESAMPSAQAETDEAMRELELAIADLPLRQQQVFVLRSIEQLDVADTARALGISEGSVKTHYSRAVHSIQDRLQAYR